MLRSSFKLAALAAAALFATTLILAAPDNETSVLLLGQSNPKAIGSDSPMPDLSSRPAELRPEALPARVRYQFEPDDAVTQAAQRARQRLLEADPAAGPLFDDSAIIQAGAWKALMKPARLKKSSGSRMTQSVAFGNRTLLLEGKFISDRTELAKLEQALVKLIAKDGGGKVRAMTAAEMDKWWTFIAFDIEEPVFILETSGGKHRFVLSFGDGRLMVLDELNGLPG